jgi:hypothetical protein
MTAGYAEWGLLSGVAISGSVLLLCESRGKDNPVRTVDERDPRGGRLTTGNEPRLGWRAGNVWVAIDAASADKLLAPAADPARWCPVPRTDPCGPGWTSSARWRTQGQGGRPPSRASVRRIFGNSSTGRPLRLPVPMGEAIFPGRSWGWSRKRLPYRKTPAGSSRSARRRLAVARPGWPETGRRHHRATDLTHISCGGDE